MNVLMLEYSYRSENMDKFDKKIARTIQQDPAYDCLDKLGPNVWQKIRRNKARQNTQAWFNFTLPPAIQAFSFVLLICACLALSQISFEKGLEQDPFDLRYFSHQSLATADLLSSNSRGMLP